MSISSFFNYIKVVEDLVLDEFFGSAHGTPAVTFTLGTSARCPLV
jgi:hypothetical protein